jgi:hypothetical protein
MEFDKFGIDKFGIDKFGIDKFEFDKIGLHGYYDLVSCFKFWARQTHIEKK